MFEHYFLADVRHNLCEICAKGRAHHLNLAQISHIVGRALWRICSNTPYESIRTAITLPAPDKLILHCPERFLQILYNIINMLRANGKADGIGPNALVCQFFIIQLRMRGGSRMDD